MKNQKDYVLHVLCISTCNASDLFLQIKFEDKEGKKNNNHKRKI